MTELEILTAVRDHNGRIGYIDLLNLGRTKQAHDTFRTKDLIEQLIKDHVLSGTPDAYGNISFGEKGRLRLKELQQRQQKEAQDAANAAKEKRSQRRHDWAIAIFSTLGGALLSDPLWALLRWILQ